VIRVFREKGLHILNNLVLTLAARGLEELYPVVLLCQFLVLAGNWFWFYILTYLEYNTVVVFFGSGRK
jgi:hypothetical protein